MTSNFLTFEIGIYNDLVNPDQNVHVLEDEPADEDLNDLVDEVASDLMEQEIQTNKRDRSDESEPATRKTRVKIKTNSENLEESSSPEQSDAEEPDERNRTERGLNSTPNTDHTLPEKAKSLQHPAIKNKMIEHYFSVKDTPNMALHPTGRRPVDTIPETPEIPIHQKPSLHPNNLHGSPPYWNQSSLDHPSTTTSAEHKTKNKQTRDASHDDDEIIRDLTGQNHQSKHFLINHEYRS